MSETLKAVLAAINSIGDLGTLSLFGALVAAGALAMAILQVIKDLTPIRRGYQRRWVARWIEQRTNNFNRNLGQARPKPRGLSPVRADESQEMLAQLATGGQTRALYNLPAEQLVAQMNAAAQAALDYPPSYLPLLAVLSEGAAIEDVARVTAASGTKGAKAPAPEDLDARNRVGHRIQRNLDGVQIALGDDWTFWMQSVAILLTAGVIEIAVLRAPGASFTTFLVALPIGILGGYLAPVARDLVAALQSLRK